MELVHKSDRIRQIILAQKEAGKTVGFIPTMGALHEGHLSLVKRAKAVTDYVVVSIYVNPTQFNQQEDLDKYPRTIERDMVLLEGVCDVVFNPLDNKEVYGDEIVLKSYNFEGLDEPLEGAFRPGHFKGMANVVSRFFEIVKPDKAFFGLKDYQQYVLVKKMVAIERYDIEVVGCPIVREENGLAMSSRNERLSHKAKHTASVIFYALQYCEKYYLHVSLEQLKQNAIDMLKGMVQVEYLEFRDAETLEVINDNTKQSEVFLSFAGYLEGIRLIDNIRFSSKV